MSIFFCGITETIPSPFHGILGILRNKILFPTLVVGIGSHSQIG
jgi:hypothetical protein